MIFSVFTKFLHSYIFCKKFLAENLELRQSQRFWMQIDHLSSLQFYHKITFYLDHYMVDLSAKTVTAKKRIPRVADGEMLDNYFRMI